MILSWKEANGFFFLASSQMMQRKETSGRYYALQKEEEYFGECEVWDNSALQSNTFDVKIRTKD